MDRSRIITVGANGVAQVAPPSPGTDTRWAAWSVFWDGGRSYDFVYFRLLHVTGCGERAIGLVKHPERVLGLSES